MVDSLNISTAWLVRLQNWNLDVLMKTVDLFFEEIKNTNGKDR